MFYSDITLQLPYSNRAMFQTSLNAGAVSLERASTSLQLSSLRLSGTKLINYSILGLSLTLDQNFVHIFNLKLKSSSDISRRGASTRKDNKICFQIFQLPLPSLLQLQIASPPPVDFR